MMLRTIKIKSKLAAIVLVGVIGCGLLQCEIERSMSDRDKLKEDLKKNQNIWNGMDIHSYSYLLAISCGTCESPKGRFEVVVVADTISKVVLDTTASGAYDASDPSVIPTIPALFAKIETALTWATAIDAHFNTVLGYPESIGVDYDGTRAGDEYAYCVDSVKALP